MANRLNINFGVVSPISVIVSYLIACPLTSRISLDLTQTHWTDLMTYIIWFFAGFIWTAIFVFLAFAVGLAVTLFGTRN